MKYGAGRPISVRLKRQGELAVLEIQDEGIGIPPEAMDRLFQKYERAVSSRHYGGLGLGLYVSRQIVSAMGGQVRVQSAPDRGATFTVELPFDGATSP